MILHHAFERLEVGDRFATHGRTVTESDVHAFAAQTGDLPPQHGDADCARSRAFGERIAHGMLVLSYAVGLAGFDPERVVAPSETRARLAAALGMLSPDEGV